MHWADTLASPPCQGPETGRDAPPTVAQPLAATPRALCPLPHRRRTGTGETSPTDQTERRPSFRGPSWSSRGAHGTHPSLFSWPGPGWWHSTQKASRLLPAAVTLSRPGRPPQPSRQTQTTAAWGSGWRGGGGQDQGGPKLRAGHPQPLWSPSGCPWGKGRVFQRLEWGPGAAGASNPAGALQLTRGRAAWRPCLRLTVQPLGPGRGVSLEERPHVAAGAPSLLPLLAGPGSLTSGYRLLSLCL